MEGVDIKPITGLTPEDRFAWSEGEDVLVTGGAGFIGARLVRTLLNAGANVICIVRDHDPQSPLWLSGDWQRVTIVTGSLEDPRVARRAVVQHEISALFHLGAQSLVQPAVCDPVATFESNIRGTWNILEACRTVGRDTIRRVVVASSDKAYGSVAGACDEQQPLNAKGPYDVSKACTDNIAHCYAQTYQLPLAIARCGNVFGPGDLNWSRIIPQTIRSLWRGEPPEIRSDGTPVRDYFYVDDAVDAYGALAQWVVERSDDERCDCAFNFSAGNTLSVSHLVDELAQRSSGNAPPPTVLNTARHEIPYQALDCSRAHRRLKWRAATPLDAALDRTIAWYDRYFNERVAGHRIEVSV